jgi:hypothetical protein
MGAYHARSSAVGQSSGADAGPPDAGERVAAGFVTGPAVGIVEQGILPNIQQ